MKSHRLGGSLAHWALRFDPGGVDPGFRVDCLVWLVAQFGQRVSQFAVLNEELLDLFRLVCQIHAQLLSVL